MKRKKRLPTLSLRDKRFAEMVAKENLRQRGIKPGSRGYEKSLTDAINTVSYEMFHHSLSPGEGLGENPSTPSIPAKVSHVFEDLEGAASGGDQLLLSRFRGVMSYLAQVYCEKRAGLKKSEDFSFHAGQTKEQMMRAESNQYFRIFVWVVMMELVEKAFEMNPERVWDTLRAGGLEGQSLESLKKSGGRERFARLLREALSQTPVGRSDVLSELRRALSSG